MSLKRMSFLTISFTMFIIVLTTIFKIGGFKVSDEVIVLSYSNNIDPMGMVNSYNYVENEKNDSVYVGKMTGYGADCKGCSGVGRLSCKTESGSTYSLRDNGMYYIDDEYGEVRIVAAALEKFPCGTIVKIDNGRFEPFYAIVMDTGYSVNNAWNNGTVWMDLAFVTESDSNIYNATSWNTTYSVQRWGW